MTGLTRAYAATWVLAGRPLIYGAHLEGPLKIAGGTTNLFITRVHVENGPSGIEVPDFPPPEWTSRR